MKSKHPEKEIKLVIIEGILPQVDGGLFCVKAVEEERIQVVADILGFGKKAVAACILFKNVVDEDWHESYMSCLENDRWRGEFTVSAVGNYVYKIRAWVDEAATWQKRVISHLRAQEPIGDLLAKGTAVLNHMYQLAGSEDGRLLQEALRMFGDEKRLEESLQMATSFRFTEWTHRYPVREGVSESGEIKITVYRKSLLFSAWYTLYPRSSSSVPGTHGTFGDVIGLLPRIKDAGFDVIHFPPVHPIGTTVRKGKNGLKNGSGDVPGSVYAIGSGEGGHDSVHPELGTLNDLKNLIKEGESLGMEVAMDLSLYFSPDHPWLKDHPDWFDSGILEKALTSAVNDAHGLVVTSFNWFETQLAVVKIISLWSAWGVRVIRIDRPDNQPLTWWMQIIEWMQEKIPDLVFYAGTFARPSTMGHLAKSGFALSDSYFMWKNSRQELESYVRELTTSPLKDYYKPIFWTNTHQINPYNLQSGHEPQHLIRFFLAASLSSCYGIYGPVFEQVAFEPFPGREDYWDSEQYEIKTWDWKKETKLTYLISLINQIRKENEALQCTHNIHFCESGHPDIMGYLKVSRQNRILCVINLDAHHRQVSMIGVPGSLIGKTHDEPYIVHDLITGARYTWKGYWNYVELDPYIMPFHLLRIEDYREELDGR